MLVWCWWLTFDQNLFEMSNTVRDFSFSLSTLSLPPLSLSPSASCEHKWLKWKWAFKLIHSHAFCWLPSCRPNVLYSNQRNKPICFFVQLPLTDKNRHVQHHFFCMRDSKNISAVAFWCSSLLESVFLLAFDVVHVVHEQVCNCAFAECPVILFVNFIYAKKKSLPFRSILSPHSVPIVAPRSMNTGDFYRFDFVSRIGENVEKNKIEKWRTVVIHWRLAGMRIIHTKSMQCNENGNRKKKRRLLLWRMWRSDNKLG